MIRSGITRPILTAGFLLLVSVTQAVAQEAPVITRYIANPGWIDLFWTHTGLDLDGFVLRREHPPAEWPVAYDARTSGDKNLTPDTEYKYQVCAIYPDYESACSDWLAVRTDLAPQPVAEHPKPPPVIDRYEAYHEPPTIRIWWKKTGQYDRVIVRWRHKTSAGAWQQDIDTSAGQGTFDAHTPTPGSYEFLLKGCTLNFVGAANCGAWSAPNLIDTAPLGASRVDCKPGMLQGAPRFEANGRAEYHFEANRPGVNVPGGGACTDPGGFQVGHYFVRGVWNPAARPGALDTSDANTLENFTVSLYPGFSPERAPKRPDVWDPTTTIHFITRAHCDRDPWLNANVVCRRTGHNVPQDVRAQWPTLLSEPFPHSRNSIPVAERGPLLGRYHQVTGQLVGAARTQSKTIDTAATAVATERRSRGRGQSAQPQQSRVDPAAEVALNPKPLPPKTTLVKPRETVMHKPATQTRAADVNRGATPLQQSPLSKLTPEQAAKAEGKELVEIRCRGGDTFNFHPNESVVVLSFLPPNRKEDGSSPPVREDGGNLAPSTCGLATRAMKIDDPVRIVFDAQLPRDRLASKQAAQSQNDIQTYLQDAAHYWTFTAYKTNYGHFRAVRHAPWVPAGAAAIAAGAEPKGGIPADLFGQDDRAIIVVGGKKLPAGELKAELRAEIKRESGAPKAVRTTSRIGELHIAGTANTPAAASGKHLAQATVSQAAIQHSQVATTRSDDRRFTQGSQTIQGTAHGIQSRASSLQVDCNAQVPRIVHVRGAIKSGEAFTIEGSCFGHEPGSVELIGLPSGKVVTPFTTWSEGTIAAMMPPVRGVQDQRLAMTVTRKGDRKTSPPREVSFVAAKNVVPVPADRWTPSARFVKSEVNHDVYQRGLLGVATDDYYAGRMKPGTAQLRAQIHPACALEAMGTTPDSGGIRRIVGWENGPPHEANVTLKWYPACTQRKERNQVTGQQWSTYICEIDFTVNATAYCPVGINP